MAIKKLKDMKPGESGLIVALHGSGNVKHRLIDMGLVHGTKIHVMKFAPLGDPVEIKVKNFELALRTSEAGMIDVDAVSYTHLKFTIPLLQTSFFTFRTYR